MPHAVPIQRWTMSRPASPPLGFITIPRGQSTADCPKSAIIISPKTERILCTRDEDFRRWTWSEVKEVISESLTLLVTTDMMLILSGLGRIDLFQRTPNDLKRYVEFRHYLNRTFGSIISFIQKERLNWPSLKPSGAAPFQNATDFKILYNDWPYGIDLDIVHLVVWTKFNFEEDQVTGDLTTRAHAGIENFVQRTFCNTRGGIARDNLIWFRNGRSLKSVQALEHFHVMLYNPDREFLRRVTNGDIAMIDKLRNGKNA